MVQMASVVLAPSGHVLSWGWFSIELANLLIIVSMVVLFVVALLAPFGRAHPHVRVGRPRTDENGDQP